MAEDGAWFWLAKDRQGLAAFKKNRTLLYPRQGASNVQVQGIFMPWALKCVQRFLVIGMPPILSL